MSTLPRAAQIAAWARAITAARARPWRRTGLVRTPCYGLETGLNPICGGSGGGTIYIPWLRVYGQSNSIGEDADQAGGSSSRPSADRGYLSSVANPKTIQRLRYAQALSSSGAQTFVDTGVTGGVTYAPAGSVNLGFWRRIPDVLQTYFGYPTFGISLENSVLGASLRRNLMPGATDGRGIFAASMASLASDMAFFGGPPIGELFIQGETDATDATDSSQYQANFTSYIAAVRAACGVPALPIFYPPVNPNLASASFLSTVRAAQAAVSAADPNVIAVSLDDFQLFLTNIHYAADELYDGADRFGFAIGRKIAPSVVPNLGSGPAPWVQGISAAVTCQASPNTANPRSGPDDTPGDLHVLFATSATTAVTITVNTPTSPTPPAFTTIANFESVFSTSHRRMLVATRPADATTIGNNAGHMPAPSVDCGANPLNVAGIVRVRSPGTPTVDVVQTGVNNGNTTALTIPTFTVSGPNRLLVIGLGTGGNTNLVSTITTAGLTWTIARNSQLNPGAGTIALTYAWALVPAGTTVIPATTVAFAATGVNVGTIVAIAP